MSQEFMSFDDAKKKAREAGFKSMREYMKSHQASGLPAAPSRFYGDRWIGWKDFLGL